MCVCEGDINNGKYTGVLGDRRPPKHIWEAHHLPRAHKMRQTALKTGRPLSGGARMLWKNWEGEKKRHQEEGRGDNEGDGNGLGWGKGAATVLWQMEDVIMVQMRRGITTTADAPCHEDVMKGEVRGSNSSMTLYPRHVSDHVTDTVAMVEKKEERNDKYEEGLQSGGVE